MTPNPILVIGSVHGSVFEKIETARLLGFEPIGVQLEGDRGHGSLTCYSWRDLPAALRDAPCLVGGFAHHPDLINERLDRKWMEGTGRLVIAAEKCGFTAWHTLIHPSAEVSESAVLGCGVFVGPLVTVSSETTVGKFVSLGRSSSIGHHVSIGPFCAVAPGVVIPGGVRLGERVVVGPAATFINGIRVGDGALVGAGSVVTRHVKKSHQVMGNPARRLKRPGALLRRGSKKLLKRALRAVGAYDRVRIIYRRLFP
jgi:acetyltransferase-like isoleucine patch superfamily enzyme